MNHQFGTQWQRTGGPRYCMPGTTNVKYQHSPRVQKTSTDSNWQLPDGVVFEDFDFTWHPDATDPPYIYQFATQHQRTGGPQYVVPGATDIKFVDQIRIKTNRVATAIVEIDHLDGNAGQIPGVTKTVRYFDNYRDTLIRIAKSLEGQHEFVWVCSSVCDYSSFDFTWHPDIWQATMLHVFSSNEQKFGDTFFMHVPTFARSAEYKALLDWCDVNFVNIHTVFRRPMPVVQHSDDTHVDAVKNHKWSAPLTVFSSGPVIGSLPTVSLWRDKTKAIVPLNYSASTVVVPQAAVSSIKTQLYDYAIIDKSARQKTDLAMDVIFISYDEPDADKNYHALKEKVPRAKRVHGVEGMERALEAAAELSKTPWYYAVFAKTMVHEDFDFSFVPDYMQQPKHYIFYSKNRANGLIYGEMAIIMYNCRLILDNRDKEFGLDYTMSFPHEVVPIISTYGNFDTSPYHAWRTAFRETAKLAYFESQRPSVDGQYRLNTWMTHAQGEYAEWVLKGAADGHAFFEQSNGNLSVLKQSFSWQWLRSRFESAYGAIN